MGEDTRQWYVKYRPDTIKDYSGERVNNLVQRRFTSEDKRPNVVMVHGTSGCGKTTICRILSKYYLCTNPNEDGTPCGVCEMCQTINERLIYGEDGVECDGVMEIDATKASGKEEIVEIIDDALVAPIFGSKKILIMDECHKLSNAAQSSLLKVLEDIPKHLVVMLATTDLDKVMPTILNRCQVKIEVHKQSVESMANVLMKIAEAERLQVSREALELIARISDRVPRESINTLEDVAKSFDGVVNVKNVTEQCNIVSSELYLDFYRAANTSLEDILLFNKKLNGMDITINSFISGLMKFTMEAIYIKHGIALEEYTRDYVREVKKLFEMYKSGDFDMLLQILEYASKMITADGNRNEVLLTTTAMRIGKIQMLAEGLELEVNRAVDENNISMAKYISELKEDIEEVKDEYNVKLDTQAVKEEYKDATSVGNISSLLVQMAEQEKADCTGEVDKQQDSEYIDTDDIDSFFSPMNKN